MSSFGSVLFNVHPLFERALAEGAWEELDPFVPTTGPYVCPVHVESIRDSLLGEHQTTKVRDYLLKAKEHSFRSACREYEDTIDNGHFDPCVPYVLADYYVSTGTLSELDLVLEFVQHPREKRNVALVGARGSGKTAAQNIWLGQRNQDLEAHGVLWLRCDGHRLFELWHAARPASQTFEHLITLEEYLRLKLLYVVAKHGSDTRRGLICRLRKQIAELDPVFNEPHQRFWDAVEQRRVVQRLDEIGRTILTEEAKHNPHRDNRSKPWRYLEDVVIDVAHRDTEGRRQKKQWLALAEELESLLESLGVWVLRIVDGIDNVHLTDPYWTSYYDWMMRQVARFLGEAPKRHQLNMVALRSRTFIDLRTRQIFPRGGGGQIDLIKLNAASAAPGAVQRARQRYLMQAVKASVSADDTVPASGTGATTLFQRIVSAVADEAELEPAGAFHFNHRTFLHNRLTLIRHVYYRLKQMGQADPEPAMVRTQVRRLSRRNLLLNGRFFLDTREDWPDLDQEVGTCAFNIFHIPERYGPQFDRKRWHGLCTCRALQTLELNGRMRDELLNQYLVRCWGYPKELVTSVLRLLRVFGMVDSALRHSPTDEQGPRRQEFSYAELADSKLSQADIELELSTAGKLFLERCFCDVDTLYYAALDAPLPAALIERGLITGHDNSLSSKAGYRSASIGTAFFFLAFLSGVAKKERESFVAPTVSSARAELEGNQERAPDLIAVVHPDGLPHQHPKGQAMLRASFEQALEAEDARDVATLHHLFELLVQNRGS